MKETNLFIIWENARYMSEKIIDDMKKEFNILKIFEVEWDKDKFAENLTRFYGTNLPKNSHKEKHCGNGKFYLIVLDDYNCNYENRDTSKGIQFVNTHMFDRKKLYRDWTGGGHKIHGTNSEKETNHDLTLLLGKNIKDFKEELELKPWDGKYEKLKSNIIGSDGWDNIKQVFYMLNNTANYLVLRNYENIFTDIYEDGHEDIDILCENKKEIEYLLNCKAKFKQDYRVHYYISVNEKNVMVDLRYVGDGYYDEEWQKSMLERKEYDIKGFYRLGLKDYYYSLIYHAIIQKPMFAYDYEIRLREMSKKLGRDILAGEKNFLDELDIFMDENNYKYTVPNDYSVLFRFDKVKCYSKISKIKKARRLFKINKMKIYDKPINVIYKIKKKLWTLTSEKKLVKGLYDKNRITNVKRFDFDRWVRGSKYFIGVKDYEPVFIKVSDKYFSASTEIEALKRLSSCNVDRKYFESVDSLEKGKDSYIVYKYEDITTLKEYKNKVGKIHDNEVLLLIKFLNEVIDDLYDKKIVHRDIRPENIMVNIENDKIVGFKIFDFGYASIDKNDYFNIESKYDKHNLIRLGKEFKYSHLKWDDAASSIRVIEYIDVLASEKFDKEFSKLKNKVGRYYLKY